MNNTIFKKNDVTLLISDHSNNSNIVANRICEQRLFHQVKYVKTKYLRQKKPFVSKFINVIENIYTKNNRYRKELEGISEPFFDEIVAFNIDILIYNFYSIISTYNPNVIVSGFEEGVLSYGFQRFNSKKLAIISHMRRVFRKPRFESALRNFYCFYPEIYKGPLNPVQVPVIEKESEIIDALRKAFELNGKDNCYKQKYIYFSSVYDFEGEHSINEIYVVEQLADLVGKDNLLVKVHPRDARSVYKEKNFNVDKNSNVPWEVIQLTYDFSDKVFITSTSGSVLAGGLMTQKPVKTYYTYKLCDIEGNFSAEKGVICINELISNPYMKDILESVKVIDKLEDILN